MTLQSVQPKRVIATGEGRMKIDAQGHEIYYRIFGSGKKTLLGLHGGPGIGHSYLERLSEVVDDDVRLVLYDQLGGGKSDRPTDDSLWQVPRFVEELETVRSNLGLGTVHLLGQSWGGMLALQYALDYPHNVRSLILSNTMASAKEYLIAVSKHRIGLGTDMHALMLKREHQNDLSAADYQDALLELNSRHLRRSSPYEPKRSRDEFQKIAAEYLADLGPAYALWGPHEFLGTGPEADFDVTDRLHEIRVPALILCGYYDEVSPDCSRTLANGLVDNEFVIFGNSSHLTILEKEANVYLAVIRDFLQRHLE